MTAQPISPSATPEPPLQAPLAQQPGPTQPAPVLPGSGPILGVSPEQNPAPSLVSPTEAPAVESASPEVNQVSRLQAILQDGPVPLPVEAGLALLALGAGIAALLLRSRIRH